MPGPVLRVVPQQEVPARQVLRAPGPRERALKHLPASRVVLPILGATIIPSMIQVVRGMQARSPRPLGTNSIGTANSNGASSGSSSSTGTGSRTTGSALNRPAGQSGGRIDGTVTQGPAMPGDAAIRAEDQVVDKKIKSICEGC